MMTLESEDDQQPLIRNNGNRGGYINNGQTSSNQLNGTDIPFVTIENSSHRQKNYGTVQSTHQKLTYTWSNVDAFGEAPQHQQSTIGTITNRFRSVIGRKIPIPRKHLLKNIAGIAYPGEVLAVLGSSGAGKTTLLNALAFRSPPGVQISPGSIRRLNGIQIDTNELRARCAYVQQDDLFIGTLTAKEHLIFQAILRMGRKISYQQKLNKVDEVIMELSLGKCKNTVIGIPGRVKGLSGGERKRLAFASELLTDPSLLLCDEPTSGLDSFMAHSVLQVLKKLAAKGKTIIITIHQPSSELFSLFDRLLLMAEGRVAFLGTTTEATTFFNQLNCPCPTNYNPADFYIQLLAIVPGKEAESRSDIRKICDTFVESELNRIDEEFCEQLAKDSIGYLEPIDGCDYEGYRATYWQQLSAILWRSWLTVLKEPMLVKMRFLQTFMVSLLIGIIFFGQVLNQDGVMNMNGALFLFLSNMTFQNVFAVINVFCTELPVFLRESHSRLYCTSAYFIGKTFAEVPLFLAVPIMFTSIAYPMVGLQATISHFGIAVLTVTLVANVAVSFGYFISCASSTLSIALSIAPALTIPFLLFGGFFLNTASVPYYFVWLSYISWFRYGNEALLINQWAEVGEGEIECTRANTTCPTSGHVILETLNFKEDNLTIDLLALILLIISLRTLAFVSLYLRARSKE